MAVATFALSLTIVGWLVAPVISFLVNKLFSYLDFNLSRKLGELKFHIIPSLTLILGVVTEERILRGAKDEGKGSGSDLKTLSELAKHLKSALYDAEDVLDLIEYHRIERKVIGNGKSLGTSWLLHAIGDHISRCKRSWFVQKLWQCTQNQNRKLRNLGAKLQQCALDLDLKYWDLVTKLQQHAQYTNQMIRDLRVRANQYIHQGAAGQP